MLWMFLVSVWLFQVFSESVENKNMKCDFNRPSHYSLQSAVCCYPMWKIIENKKLKGTASIALDDLISEFVSNSGSTAWLVDVTNFLQFNVGSQNHPIIIRWPVPV